MNHGEEEKVVLVIEDDAETVMLLHLALDRQGIKMVAKFSGEEALATMTALKPDLVLLDILMPGMDGREVYRRMKASPRLARIPIIIVSALLESTARMQDHCLDEETEYIVKPFRVNVLVDKVKQHLVAPARCATGRQQSLSAS